MKPNYKIANIIDALKEKPDLFSFKTEQEVKEESDDNYAVVLHSQEEQEYWNSEIFGYDESEGIRHYGIKFRSGRYPYGSGEDPYQHMGDFYSRSRQMEKENFTFTDKDGNVLKGKAAIAAYYDMSKPEFDLMYSIAKDEYKLQQRKTIESLRQDGLNDTEIARKMGLKGESSVRSLMKDSVKENLSNSKATADLLKSKLENGSGMVDIGKGTELYLGVSKQKLEKAVAELQLEGYELYSQRVPQVTNPGQFTTRMVLCKPGTEYKDIYQFDNVDTVTDFVSYDEGESYRKAFEYPSSMDSNRLMIKYNEEGGVNKDGMIEIRKGVQDLSLGDDMYSQVRILVDNDRYLKGMAVYGSDDEFPDGVDVIFNTNKHEGTATRDVLKKIKDDPDNPFGSAIKEHGGQSYYEDENGEYTNPLTGKKESLSLINKTKEQGDVGDWEKGLPSQFLAKQSDELIQKQLNLTQAYKLEEYDEIKNLTNPTLKRVLLEKFADECESDAVELKAVALPRQTSSLILGLESIKDNEVYAPNYKNGETVALVRYPHAGTFEIPILTVNNKNAEGKRVISPSSQDAIGISKAVADRLSGADFDGDTVTVIPCNSDTSKVRITSTPALKGLEGFDTKEKYGPDSINPVKVVKNSNGKVVSEYYERNGHTYKRMTNTQNEMGRISNLITDMTIKNASEDELAKAVRHSMVVIDAEKHCLDYKQSYIDNDIAGLNKKYKTTVNEDGTTSSGASTLLSKAKSETHITLTQGSAKYDEEGNKYYNVAEDEKRFYTDKKTGKTVERTKKSTQMADTDDAYKLSSGTKKESYYAEYANSLKALAKEARKEMMATPKLAYSKSAANEYKEEVKSLESKLKLSDMNAPKERQANAIASSNVKAKVASNPALAEDKSSLKKIKQQALTEARTRLGAKRYEIEITDSEWEAIQNGAVSDTKLTKILKRTDNGKLRERATPRATTTMSTAKINKMKAYQNSGYTLAEIAEQMGVSTSTVSKYLNE